jgi:hypothetical protein
MSVVTATGDGDPEMRVATATAIRRSVAATVIRR